MKPITVARLGLGLGLATQLAILLVWYFSGWAHELSMALLGAWGGAWYRAVSPLALSLYRWIGRHQDDA